MKKTSTRPALCLCLILSLILSLHIHGGIARAEQWTRPQAFTIRKTEAPKSTPFLLENPGRQPLSVLTRQRRLIRQSGRSRAVFVAGFSGQSASTHPRLSGGRWDACRLIVPNQSRIDYIHHQDGL